MIEFKNGVSLVSGGNAVGKTEHEGPLGEAFDRVIEDDYCGEKTYEQAEIRLQQYALDNALEKSGLKLSDVGLVAAGDLLNQCVASGYSARRHALPFVGLFGACSTMALSVIVAAAAVQCGFVRFAAGVTSSHFCSAERQFRTPLEYGAQRTPSAQRTVTAGAAVIVGKNGKIRLTRAAVGRVLDYSVTDMSNMGAAMAPAACDTLCGFLDGSGASPSDFDGIYSGDLGAVGSDILRDLVKQRGYTLGNNYFDCGLMIFDREKQDVHSGGSGCGCSGSVLTAHIMPRLCRGELKRVLFMSTGALMSPTLSQQGESIPAIAHLIELEACP